jgi:multiple sugar transport system ATP-binding protein
MFEIRLEKLTKRFGSGLVAVDNADLQVGQGEVMCLLGPSGCGKTTMLRMIAGLEWATSGDVMIAGKRVNDLPARERNVAMAFQFYALYPSLSVEDNLAYPLHAENLSKAEIASRVARVSEALDLKGILKRRPHQLGEGEKQRVAVGRSIVRDPTCFLFDEPLSRLDIQLRQTMRTQIKEILAKLDKPTVIVTHDQIEALTMADRIAVMQKGKVEQVATPRELFSRPTNLFVASFIGTPQMNLLSATLADMEPVASNGSVNARFRVLGETISALVDGGVARLAKGSGVTLGIRPRSFEFVNPGTTDALHATVDLTEPMGAETLAHLIEQGVDMRCVVQSNVAPSTGDRVAVRCKAGQLHVFDESGNLVGETHAAVPR